MLLMIGIMQGGLTGGHQHVDIVAANKVVCKADDRALQACLSVMVGCVRRHKAGQLRHLSMPE